MYNCFKELKESFKNYQAYASGYDPHQYERHANDSGFKPQYNSPEVTGGMERLLKAPVSRKDRMKTLVSNISDSVGHTFTYGAFAIVNYVHPKNPSFSSDKYTDVYDTNILSRATCIDEDGNQYPPEKPLDHSWGLIDCDNLTVVFKNTNPPPKPPRRAMKLRK
ncbi:hypothetical protein MFLAVUS_006474 [Mucor flavus]|uniref:Uncharacterized protein n=1 Tax=Mucor flavus TaxID=439312 RepID=A0ABP9Z1M5_9FUNG